MTTIVDSVSFIKHLSTYCVPEAGATTANTMGVGAGRQFGGFWEEETWGVAQSLSSPTPCPGRCLQARRPRRPRGPRALRAQDQAADPEAAAARAEDALPAARRPPAAVGPRPAPRPGAAARRLRQGRRRRRQEGQDEEEAVREVTPPLGPPLGPGVDISQQVSPVCCSVPVRGLRGGCRSRCP